MGFMDKIKNIINVPEEDYYEDIDDEEIVSYGSSRSNSPAERAAAAAEARHRVSASVGSNNAGNNSNKVVNIHTTAQLQVVLVKPEAFADASTIADHLNNKRTVVLNLESATREIARRLVDFLSGVAYANGGQLKRVANSTYIITPYNVDVMGDLIDELENNGVFF